MSEKATEYIGLKLNKELKQWIDEQAKKQKISSSAFIRKSLESIKNPEEAVNNAKPLFEDFFQKEENKLSRYTIYTKAEYCLWCIKSDSKLSWHIMDFNAPELYRLGLIMAQKMEKNRGSNNGFYKAYEATMKEFSEGQRGKAMMLHRAIYINSSSILFKFDESDLSAWLENMISWRILANHFLYGALEPGTDKYKKATKAIEVMSSVLESMDIHTICDLEKLASNEIFDHERGWHESVYSEEEERRVRTHSAYCKSRDWNDPNWTQ